MTTKADWEARADYLHIAAVRLREEAAKLQRRADEYDVGAERAKEEAARIAGQLRRDE